MEIVGSEIMFEGTLDRSTVVRLYEDFHRRRPTGLRAIDLDRVDRVDSAGVAFLEYVRRSQNPPAAYQNANESVAGMLELLSAEVNGETPVVRDSTLARFGGWLLDTIETVSSFLTLSASITFWSIMAPFDRHARQKGAIANQCRSIGSSAVPIVGFLALIIGVIVVLQAVLQLRQFGADIFVVDLLALSVTREMGPLITAILVAGRSGSAIAAQVATMKVTEELDALTVMALDPIRYVMVPMLIGMTISIPLLTGLSILVGIGGGMLVAGLALGLAAETFISRLADVLGPLDLFIGVGKSFFFGAAIVFTGCHFGLSSTGGSEGVGRATTQSVVVSIFAVIALDAIFSLFYLI